MMKLSMEELSHFHRVTQQMGAATSTQSFLSYPDIFMSGKGFENNRPNSPSLSQGSPFSSVHWKCFCLPPRAKSTQCQKKQEFFNADTYRLLKPGMKRQSRAHPFGSLTLDLQGGEPCAKGDLRGKQDLIIKAVRYARQNLPHKICKSHCSRTGWLDR